MNENIPIKTGDVVRLKITALGSGGEGVARYEGFAVFVPFALPGETVDAKIGEIKKNYAAARLIKIIERSPDRVDSDCPVYYRCGGCQLRHIAYKAELAAKKQIVIDALKRIGGEKNPAVEDVMGGEPYHYRNKVQFPVGKKNGAVVVGCYAKGTHEIVNVTDCLIEKRGNNKIVAAVREVAHNLGISIYDENKHKGVLRHVCGRETAKGELMAILVTNTEVLPKEKTFVKELLTRVKDLVSIQQNIQHYHNNVILGRDTKVLWGKETIADKIGKLRFNISARSFFQVNNDQAAKLYEKAAEFASLTKKETVIDAYCGTGTISLFLAQQARRVVGIEIVPQAIYDAEKNARENGVKNAEFMTGDAAKIMPALYKDGFIADVIVLDPPRAGCAPEVLTAAVGMNPLKIIYVSCNPATLARDVAILREKGYFLRRAQPVDMFPRTVHVETVAEIVRKQ